MVCQGEFSRDRQGHPAIAEPGWTEGSLPFSWRDQPFHLQFLAQEKEAHDFLRWLSKPKQLGAWYDVAVSYYQPLLHAYDNAPMWNVEPRNIPYRDALGTSHLPGWPAPPDRRLAESVAKYVVVDMFAKACAGASTKEVIKTAEDQLKGIYKTA